MAARKLNSLILVTIVLNALAIALVAVAFGTNDWFHSTAQDQENSLSVKIKYGIFKGHKSITQTSTGNLKEHDIFLTCLMGDNICMFSCGLDADKRQEEIKSIRDDADKVTADALCSDTSGEAKLGQNNHLHKNLSRAGAKVEVKFINFGMLISTLVFLAISLVFMVVSGCLALYNTYRAPIHPVLSVFGLYIWNAIAAIAILFAMILWLGVHLTTLRTNSVISQTLVAGEYVRYSTIKPTLGYSFWILLPSFLMCIANLVILKVRAWKIYKSEENHVKVMNSNLDNGDILLF